jgi:hypothetical protein
MALGQDGGRAVRWVGDPLSPPLGPGAGGDRFEVHAPVDGLGGQGVAQLVWMDFHFAGPPDAPDNASDLVTVQRSAVVGGKTPMAVDVLQVGGGPGGKQLDELGMERHVALVAELAERDAQPVALADAHDASASRPASSPARMPVRASACSAVVARLPAYPGELVWCDSGPG